MAQADSWECLGLLILKVLLAYLVAGVSSGVAYRPLGLLRPLYVNM
jgi:hypothetical protein